MYDPYKYWTSTLERHYYTIFTIEYDKGITNRNQLHIMNLNLTNVNQDSSREHLTRGL